MSNEQRQADWDLCDVTWRRATDRYGDTAVATDFSPTDRVVVLVWTAYGIVENGGFEYLFSSDLPGDPTYQLTLDAFRTIGSVAAASALEDALAAFPTGTPPTEVDERLALFRML